MPCVKPQSIQTHISLVSDHTSTASRAHIPSEIFVLLFERPSSKLERIHNMGEGGERMCRATEGGKGASATGVMRQLQVPQLSRK